VAFPRAFAALDPGLTSLHPCTESPGKTVVLCKPGSAKTRPASELQIAWYPNLNASLMMLSPAVTSQSYLLAIAAIARQ